MGSLEDIHDLVGYYVFWSLFYALGPMIWFYPLNELDITGYEAFAAVWLIPIVTAIPRVRLYLSFRLGQLLLDTGMLLGLLSFRATSTLLRLKSLSLGNGAAMLYLCSRLFWGSRESRWRHLWLLIGGNLIFLASRIPKKSIAPAWADSQTNLAVIAVFIASVAFKHFYAELVSVDSEKAEVEEPEAAEESDGGSSTDLDLNVNEDEVTETSERSRPSMLSQALFGVLLGSILYLSHWVFGELGVLSRWTVVGYPTTGPTPFASAPLVLLALCGGTFIPELAPKFSSSIFCWLFGSCCFVGTYFLDGWPGFCCGLLLAAYCSVLWLMGFDKVVKCHPGVLLTVAMLTYLGQIFFHVWTVAYNFVPGGVYTREHSDYLVGFMCLSFLGCVGKLGGDSVPFKSFRPKSMNAILIGALVVAGCGTLSRITLQPAYSSTKVLNPDTRHFSALIWTFHFGYDNQGWPSLLRAADLLNKTDVDVIALLESDASKPYLGHNDLAMWLSETLGMFVDFGPATKDHTWGNLLLSKYPFVNSTHHLLPSPHGELAPAISATINISGALVDIISTHMGNDRDSVDRQIQAQYLAQLSSESPNPVVFLGYVTSSPGGRDYKQFTQNGGLKDIDSSDRDRFCEYIFYKNLIREAYARISHGGLSDTELQMAKFSIPRDVGSYRDHDRTEIDPKQFDKWKQLPSDFGEHTRGHFSRWQNHYHMATPKYFVRV